MLLSLVKYRFYPWWFVILMQLTINGNAREFDAVALNVQGLVVLLAITGKRIAIELNGEIVPRGLFESTPLNSGDQLEIVGAVGGG